MDYVILDTNILLLDPNAYLKFPNKHIIIPLIVIEELDSFKREMTSIGKAAREIIRAIDLLRTKGKLTEGVKLENSSILQVFILENLEELPEGLDRVIKDNYLLSTGIKLKKVYNKKVTIITKDADLRIKADVLGIHAEDYNTNHSDTIEKLYTGERIIQTTEEWIDKFYHNEELIWNVEKPNFALDYIEPIVVNEYITLKSERKSALARAHKSGRLIHIKEKKILNIIPKNREQRFTIDALLDPEIQLVTIAGRAGTGKTLLALAAGLYQVLENQLYKKLLVARPVIPMGRDIGFLPGELEEKIKPWMQPIYDNLEFLLENDENEEIYQKEKIDKKRDIHTTLDYLKQMGILDVEPLTYIRGRSIPRQFIIIDEAQNLSPHEAKTIITRAGIGTKIVLTGDYYQIDHPYLNLYTNGISYTFNKMMGQPIFAHVTLEKGERSELAELASKLMEL
ncbi:MAG: PhoH family protein [Leptospiraceae bacterium]|jgi:PhoH-like ATPase|nr:PhoH family protein [Leptospiraceae bacterium]